MSTVVEELREQEAPEAPAAPPPEAAPPAPIHEEPPQRYLRPSVAAGLMAAATGFLVGGMFSGFLPRAYAILGGVLGILLANWAARPHKRQTLVQVASIVGIFFIGMLALGIADPGHIGNLPKVVGEAIRNARFRRPPVNFDDGWRAVLPWTIASIGYASAWIGIVVRKPAVAVLLPMPVIAFSAIAQPPEAQVVGGVVVLVCFIVSLAVIFRPDYGDESVERMPLGFEIKRAMRTAPFVVVLAAGMAVLGQTNLLFPAPLYDPAQKAVLPKAVPLEAVEDRVLFTVQSTITGPWRTGVLDVYDGSAWRLPPFAASDFERVPQTGLLDRSLTAGSAAHFDLEELEGTVLPTPTRARVIVGELPQLVTDDRTGTVRVQVGQVKGGLEYDVGFAFLPEEKLLRRAPPPPPEMSEYLDTHGEEPTPTVQSLAERAPDDDLWSKLDFIRQRFLKTVVATGSGIPEAVPPESVEDMLSGSQEGSPFEIVAAQALMARWVGVPARIGYGFDGGDQKGPNLLEIHPKHGSLWLEVWFDGFGWLPVTGQPQQAQASLDQKVQIEANLIPTDDIAINLWIPLRVPPSGVLLRRIQALVMLAIPVAGVAFLIYSIWPGFVKARRRGQRRVWGQQHGSRARIAVSYAEFRDLATDLGLGDPFVTPLAFLEECVPDEEHEELAWLVTRTLWGDLSGHVSTEDVYAAEELARSLRRRLFEAQPITIRAISFVSRLSLRTPYAPELPPFHVPRLRGKAKEVAHAPA